MTAVGKENPQPQTFYLMFTLAPVGNVIFSVKVLTFTGEYEIAILNKIAIFEFTFGKHNSTIYFLNW